MTDASVLPTRRVDLWFAGTSPQNRWSVGFRIILAIPQLFVLLVLYVVAFFVAVIGWFGALFTGRLPMWAHEFLTGLVRWSTRVSAYVLLLTDRYPPFSLDAGQYAVVLEVDYPTELSRWMIFIKWLLVIPNLIVVLLLGVVSILLTIVAWFAILFTGQFPRALFDFVVGVHRWFWRASGYALYFYTDSYPPFGMSP